ERAPAGSDRQFQLVGAFARTARGESDIARLRGAFEGTQPYPGLELDQDLRWSLIAALATLGATTEDEIAAELRRDDTNAGRERAFHARAALPTPEAKAEAWRLAVEEDGQPNSVVEALGTGFNRALDAQGLLGAYVARWHDMLLPVWQSRSAAIRERIVNSFYPLSLVGPELEAATSGWLEAHPDAPPALRRLVSEHLDTVRTAVRAQEADAKRG
ncbi:MAG: ERAP1-like C-terminal domain-containing protein, partial [Actinomycetota bacterium]|nr:ERAP1-like C-terminal domain-containing protein [Actinomycetota bacterium]